MQNMSKLKILWLSVFFFFKWSFQYSTFSQIPLMVTLQISIILLLDDDITFYFIEKNRSHQARTL